MAGADDGHRWSFGREVHASEIEAEGGLGDLREGGGIARLPEGYEAGAQPFEKLRVAPGGLKEALGPIFAVPKAAMDGRLDVGEGK
jgi:hypothetical protein